MPDKTTPLGELCNLLVSMFSAPEMRLFIRSLPEGSDLLVALPGELAAPAIFFDEIVMLLSRRGRLNAAFFDALARVRPAREGEIREVERVVPARPSASTVPVDVPSVVQRAEVVLEAHRALWEDGGFDPRHHACVAGTSEGALRSIRERLEDLDYLSEQSADVRTHQQVKLYVRYLYGAVVHWRRLALGGPS